mmetsp:Transcript_63835/g.128279  ORF Transcript_63835/g.128279 Transcript_63835/m.128279 type:complete len:270 (-) Transcript_63835:413-1222(-)
MPIIKRQEDDLVGLVAEVTGWVDKVELDSTAYTVYTIQCTKEGNTWAVEKRFSDLHDFEENIRDQVEIRAPFPSKQANKLTGQLSAGQKEERQETIRVWLNELLKQSVSQVVIAQIFNFFNVLKHTDQYETKSAMRRHAPGRVHFEGYVTKLGGNKDDPYNLAKGKWARRYLVLQDDLRFFQDEATWRRGGAPKGVVSLDTFFVSSEGQGGMFTVHAVPSPFICRTEKPEEAEAWVAALDEFAFGGFEASMVPGNEDSAFRKSNYVPDL